MTRKRTTRITAVLSTLAVGVLGFVGGLAIDDDDADAGDTPAGVADVDDAGHYCNTTLEVCYER